MGIRDVETLDGFPIAFAVLAIPLLRVDSTLLSRGYVFRGSVSHPFKIFYAGLTCIPSWSAIFARFPGVHPSLSSESMNVSKLVGVIPMPAGQSTFIILSQASQIEQVGSAIGTLPKRSLYSARADSWDHSETNVSPQ
jgi:hypothetical protein